MQYSSSEHLQRSKTFRRRAKDATDLKEKEWLESQSRKFLSLAKLAKSEEKAGRMPTGPSKKPAPTIAPKR